MSTTSEIPPSSRPSITDQPTGPITLFDIHLKYLTDSYINFFLERKKVEETYIASLKNLALKCRQNDEALDERIGGEKLSSRSAWVEVRDNVEREAETRLAFLGTLSTDIINPLITLKDTQDRIRKRIREDIKDAVNAHVDYAENVYPKLKRSYLKKAQEVEDLKQAASNAPPPSSPTISSSDHHSFTPPTKSSSGPIGRPIVTGPQPLRPLDRRPLGSIPSSRQRSPPPSKPLQDLAHQGKKQLNQLMTFLDKGGVKETLAGRAENTALRAVRAKREADEADKEYRKAVHWLETLRLRREKLLEGGYNSLESFVAEVSHTMKKVLVRYTDNLSPKPVYYYNYTVGECRDLVFGVSLTDYANSRDLEEGDIPRIIKISIREIEERGLNAEGIYRVSGRHAAVQELQHKIERNEAAFSFHAPGDDVYVVASLLKLYLRELPEPVFKFPLQERVQHTGDLEKHASNNFQLLRSKIRRLPPIHQATLKAIVEHLARIAARQEKNKMDTKNLAIVFGSVIFGEDEMPKAGDLLSVQSLKDTLMEDLIKNAHILFQQNNSPPLPPAPLGEPPHPASYNNSRTRVSMGPPPPPSPPPPPLPPRSPSPRYPSDPFLEPTLPLRIHKANGSGSLKAASSEDFTPQLPPRPANSIHPSLRAGPPASSPIRKQAPPSIRSAQWFDDSTAPNFSNVLPPSVSASTSTSTTQQQPSVPPSPTRREKRESRSNFLAPLASPWSDSNSAANSVRSSRDASVIVNDGPDAKESPERRSSLEEGPQSGGSAGTFESAISAAFSGQQHGDDQHSPSPGGEVEVLPATPPPPPKPPLQAEAVSAPSGSTQAIAAFVESKLGLGSNPGSAPALDLKPLVPPGPSEGSGQLVARQESLGDQSIGVKEEAVNGQSRSSLDASPSK